MPKYLYIFAYQTTEQAAQVGPEPVESSEACFIEAPSAEQALEWGREISEAFVRHIFAGQDLSWKQGGFAHWIESEPRNEYPADVLKSLPAVAVGQYPEFAHAPKP